MGIFIDGLTPFYIGMANYKSEYEKVRKASAEAINLLKTEKLLTDEISFQETIRGKLLEAVKKYGMYVGQKVIPGMRTVKNLMEKEAKYTSIKLSLQAKIADKEDKLKKATSARSAAIHASQLSKLKRQYATNQGLLTQVLSKQARIAGVMKIITTEALMFKAAIVLALGIFKEFDEEASRFRMRMGMIRSDTASMEKSMYRSWVSLTSVGVTMKDLTASAESLTDSFGSLWAVTDEMRDTLSVWQAQLGVSTKSGAELLRVFSQIDGSTAQSQVNMGNFLSRMTRAAGVPLNETMGDVANASKTAYSMMARNPLAIAKAAVEARRLGTTLDAIAKSGKTLLNFTDSINAEMNASVLLGKSINLQRARELAYRRDMAGLNREIVRLARDEVDFNKMDTFQQEAFAAALGKSADEIAKMLQAERQMNWIRANGTVEQREQLNQLEAMKRVNEDLAKDMGAQAGESLRTQANQSKLAALSNTWKQLLMEIVDIFVPIISSVLSIATAVLKFLKPFVKIAVWAYMIYKGFVLIKAAIAAIGVAIGWPVAAVIALAAALYLVIKYWDVIWKYAKMVGNAMWEGIKAVGTAIFDAIVWPFKKAYEWLSGIFLGESPSQIGMMIAEGIKSVGSLILNNLLWPFKMARWAIRKLFGGKSIAGEVGSPTVASAGDEAAGAVRGAAAAGTTTTLKRKEDAVSLVPTMMGILEAVNGLRSDLNQGKVAIYLDSQLVSTHSMRNTLFRKGYGTNNAIAS